MLPGKVYINEGRKIWRIALPIMGALVLHILVGIADSVMVGRVDADMLAAVTQANVFLMLLFTFGMGISQGLTTLVANGDGRNDDHQLARLLKNGKWLFGVTGIVLMVVVYFCADLLYYLDQPEKVTDLAIPYMRIMGASLVPVMLFQHYKQFAEGLSFTKKAMLFVLYANGLNIILNAFLIYGLWIFPRMELNGAGWASLISRIFMALLMIVYISKAPPFAKYRDLLVDVRLRWSSFREMLAMGLPIGMQYFFEAGAFCFAGLMVGWIGPHAQAAHQIAISMASFSFVTAMGISSAVTVRVGQEMGRKNWHRLRVAGQTGIMLGLVIMAAWALVFICFHSVIPQAFTGEADVQSIAATLLIIAALFQLSDGGQVLAMGCLRGLGDVKVPSLVALFSYWIIGIPLAWLFAFHWGWAANGVWVGLALGLTSAAILLNLRFYWKTGDYLKKERHPFRQRSFQG